MRFSDGVGGRTSNLQPSRAGAQTQVFEAAEAARIVQVRGWSRAVAGGMIVVGGVASPENA
ncbi:MAG: hypothetical protein KF785_08915 [Gemmatimonadales bacterium]|nr:hypothetical protein [Gemmatimonadales bacterium]